MPSVVPIGAFVFALAAAAVSVLQLIQDGGSWAEAAAVALTAGDDAASDGQEARLEQLLQRTQR